MLKGNLIYSCNPDQIGRLHCLYPWWDDATVNFMISGGYNVNGQIEQVCLQVVIFPSVLLKVLSLCSCFVLFLIVVCWKLKLFILSFVSRC